MKDNKELSIQEYLDSQRNRDIPLSKDNDLNIYVALYRILEKETEEMRLPHSFTSTTINKLKVKKLRRNDITTQLKLLIWFIVMFSLFFFGLVITGADSKIGLSATFESIKYFIALFVFVFIAVQYLDYRLINK